MTIQEMKFMQALILCWPWGSCLMIIIMNTNVSHLGLVGFADDGGVGTSFGISVLLDMEGRISAQQIHFACKV